MDKFVMTSSDILRQTVKAVKCRGCQFIFDKVMLKRCVHCMNVSVVIPLYNKSRYITRAINSVLAQTHKNFELIVVDDGSTDNGKEVVRQVADPRLRLITQDNAGASAARNRGIQEARAELVAFLDADDEWLPEFLEIVMGLHERHPEAGMFATAYRCCAGEKTWHPIYIDCPNSHNGGLLADYFSSSIYSTPVCSSAVMIPKQVLRVIGLFPVGISRGEDLNTWARIAFRYRVAWSPMVGAIYHLSANNRACNFDWVGPDIGVASAIEDFLKSGEVSVSSREFIEEYLRHGRIGSAMACILTGKHFLALELLEKSRETKIFRMKWMFVSCMARIPLPILRFAISIKAFLRHTVALFLSKRCIK